MTRHPGDYIEPRLAAYVDFGASPRASIAFTSAARARALIDGRNHVVPDDVKALTHRVLRHRVDPRLRGGRRRRAASRRSSTR